MDSDITQGLMLEDRGVRLIWRSSPDELATTAPADISCVQNGNTVFVWNSRVWGGLKCQVTTTFGGSRWPQTALLGLRILVDAPSGFRSCSSAFQWLNGKLIEQFGSAASIAENGEAGEAIWRIGNVTLRHEYFAGMGGGHFVFLFLDRVVAAAAADTTGA